MVGYFCNFRSEMLSFLPNAPVNILEIGCGAGNFIAQIRTEGERWGVELDRLAATEASENLTKVLNGTFAEVKNKLPVKYFDLVICNIELICGFLHLKAWSVV